MTADQPPVDAYEGLVPSPQEKAAAEAASRENDTSHLPPQNLEAEEALLGAMLMSDAAVVAADDEGVHAEVFYRPSHRTIYDAIQTVRSEAVVDELTVIDKLKRMTVPGEGGKKVKALGSVGGAAAIMSLVERVPAVANARAYAKEVVETSTKRRFVEIGHELATMGYDNAVSAVSAQEEAERLVLETARRAGRRHAAGEEFESDQSIDAFIEQYARLQDEEAYNRETLSWGSPELDERLGRMERGALYVPAGWTKHGKTWWCLDVIEAVARQGHRSILFSAEMNDKEVTERFVAMGGHDYTKVQEKKLPLPVLRDRLDEIKGWDRKTVQGKTTVARIKSEVMRAKLEGRPVRLVVVDHLGLVRPDRGAKFQPRREFVEDAVAELKAHAEEHGYTLLLVAQLSRPERTPGNHPRFKRQPFEGDLKDASGIEQIATCVIFVYRSMDAQTGKFIDQDASLVFPFHRSRPTPKALACRFTLPQDGNSSGAYRFRPVAQVGSSLSGAPASFAPVQQHLEGQFGPVTVVTPDDMEIH